MATRESVEEFVFSRLAAACEVDRSVLTPDTNIIADLKATSKHFFPVMAALEDEYEIDLNYSSVRVHSKTIGGLVDYLMTLI